MNMLKAIAILFGTFSFIDILPCIHAALTGQLGFALLYLLFSGYFAFRCKQLLEDSK